MFLQCGSPKRVSGSLLTGAHPIGKTVATCVSELLRTANDPYTSENPHAKPSSFTVEKLDWYVVGKGAGSGGSGCDPFFASSTVEIVHIDSGGIVIVNVAVARSTTMCGCLTNTDVALEHHRFSFLGIVPLAKLRGFGAT